MASAAGTQQVLTLSLDDGLVAALRNPELVDLFWETLQSQCCEENLAFYLAVEHYKALASPAERRAKALDIWRSHLVHDATLALNAPEALKRECDQCLFPPPPPPPSSSQSSQATVPAEALVPSSPPPPQPDASAAAAMVDDPAVTVFDALQQHCFQRLRADFQLFVDSDAYRHYLQSHKVSADAAGSHADSTSSSAPQANDAVLLASLDPNVSLFVPRTVTLKDKVTKQPYTAFVVVICASGKSWQLYQRYSDFLKSHTRLLQEFESKPASYYMQPLPPFPPKKLFKNDPSFIESRRQELQEYLQLLACHPYITKNTQRNGIEVAQVLLALLPGSAEAHLCLQYLDGLARTIQQIKVGISSSFNTKANQLEGTSATLPTESLVVVDETEPVLTLLLTIERVFDHGLKDIAIFGRTVFWDFIEHLNECIPKGSNILQLAKEHGSNDLHRGRIFLRLALNEGSACLCSYIQALTWNKKLTQKYYAENALFRSDELLNALLDILHKADDITFCLWYKEPELKKRSYYRKRLLLSGAGSMREVQQDESAATLPDIQDWLLPTGTMIHGHRAPSTVLQDNAVGVAVISSPPRSAHSSSSSLPTSPVRESSAPLTTPVNSADVDDLESALTPDTPPPRPVQFPKEARRTLVSSRRDATPNRRQSLRVNAAATNTVQQDASGPKVGEQLTASLWSIVCISIVKEERMSGVYKSLLEQQSPFAGQINEDIHRTLTSLSFEVGNGPAMLNNILCAFSLHEAELGYSQELAFVAAVLLLQLEEEGTFWVLGWLAKKYSLNGRSLFGQDLFVLRQSLAAFNVLLERQLPALSAHLTACGVESSMYLSHWLCTLFVYGFPIEVVFRVWDVLFLENWEHIFKVALGIMLLIEGELLQQHGLEEILRCLRQCGATLDPSRLIAAAETVSLPSNFATLMAQNQFV